MKKSMKTIALIGSAFGQGAAINTTALGPLYLKQDYKLCEKLSALNIQSHWHDIVQSTRLDITNLPNKPHHHLAVLEHCQVLFNIVKTLVEQHPSSFPLMIGGDHSCAIGTWSGIIDALHAYNDFGLIWIDAHMDAHDYQSSPSKNYHGMPLSVLLGRGDEDMLKIGHAPVKLNPKHVVLIGVRSYESGEAAFLHSNHVKIITNEDVFKRGMKDVFEEALSIVTQAKHGFGVSFDLDAIDPLQAPGTGSLAPNGLSWDDMRAHFHILFKHKQFKALEIAEFNPTLDKNDLTANIIFETICELSKINSETR